MFMHCFIGGLAMLVGSAVGIPHVDNMGNMSMTINTPSSEAQRFFNQGLRFTSAFKFNYAVESHIAALQADPNCAMCEWGLSLAYGQNLNDALVLELEPWFLDNEPLAYHAVRRAQTRLSAEEGGGDTGGGSPSHDRDTALVSALARRYVSTVEEYKSYFEDGLPASLNLAYAEAMADAAERSAEEGWPDHVMVLVLSADAWMNLSPWHYWETPHTMRPNAKMARSLLENAMSQDPQNPWAIHLYTHLMEAGGEAAAAVAPAQKLEYLVPGAPHLQHMQSHVEFRTGQWHEASEANLRAVALPFSDAAYPDHNMDMLMWALGVEGRRTESQQIGLRLRAYSTSRVLAGVKEPLLPPERYLAQEALHLVAFADWNGVLSLPVPPETADFPMAVYHFARSLAFVDSKEWDSYRLEQGLITANLEKMEGNMDYYGVYNAPVLTKILDILSRAEGLRGGISTRDASSAAAAIANATEDGSVRRVLLDSRATSGGGGVRVSCDHLRGLKEDGHTAAAPSAPNTTAARHEELELLRQAVELEDSLGYDEPPQLPVPMRLFLGAALLRGTSGNWSMSGTAATEWVPPPEHVVEADSLFREQEKRYPNMGRTLLGLSWVSAALGRNSEALEFRQRYLDSWQYSEDSLCDSAHVHGRYVDARQGGYNGGGGVDDNGGLEPPEGGAAVSASVAVSAPTSNRTGRQVMTASVVIVAALSLTFVVARNGLLRKRHGRNLSAMRAVAPLARLGSHGYSDIGDNDSLVVGG